MDEDIYVVIFDNDKPIKMRTSTYVDERGPLVMEQYTNGASYKNALNKIDRFKGKYGKARIAKLVFVD